MYLCNISNDAINTGIQFHVFTNQNLLSLQLVRERDNVLCAGGTAQSTGFAELEWLADAAALSAALSTGL